MVLRHFKPFLTLSNTFLRKNLQVEKIDKYVDASGAKQPNSWRFWGRKCATFLSCSPFHHHSPAHDAKNELHK